MDREQAIAVIEKARQAHADWIEWIRACPDEAASPAPRIETAGDVKYHEGWVEDYDGVLKVLKDRRRLGEIPPAW